MKFRKKDNLSNLTSKVQVAQGPVRDGGTGTHWSFPTGSSLPSLYRAPGLGHLPALPQHRQDGRASGVPVSGP